VPAVKAQPYFFNARDGNVADNPTHPTVPDLLIAPWHVVEERRTKYIAVSRLSADDYGAVETLVAVAEGSAGEGQPLLEMLLGQAYTAGADEEEGGGTAGQGGAVTSAGGSLAASTAGTTEGGGSGAATWSPPVTGFGTIPPATPLPLQPDMNGASVPAALLLALPSPAYSPYAAGSDTSSDGGWSQAELAAGLRGLSGADGAATTFGGPAPSSSSTAAALSIAAALGVRVLPPLHALDSSGAVDAAAVQMPVASDGIGFADWGDVRAAAAAARAAAVSAALSAGLPAGQAAAYAQTQYAAAIAALAAAGAAGGTGSLYQGSLQRAAAVAASAAGLLPAASDAALNNAPGRADASARIAAAGTAAAEAAAVRAGAALQLARQRVDSASTYHDPLGHLVPAAATGAAVDPSYAIPGVDPAAAAAAAAAAGFTAGAAASAAAAACDDVMMAADGDAAAVAAAVAACVAALPASGNATATSATPAAVGSLSAAGSGAAAGFAPPSTWPSDVYGDEGPFFTTPSDDWEDRHWQFNGSYSDRADDYRNFRDRKAVPGGDAASSSGAFAGGACSDIHHRAVLQYTECVRLQGQATAWGDAPAWNNSAWAAQSYARALNTDALEACLALHEALLASYEACLHSRDPDLTTLAEWQPGGRECVGGGGICGPPSDTVQAAVGSGIGLGEAGRDVALAAAAAAAAAAAGNGSAGANSTAASRLPAYGLAGIDRMDSARTQGVGAPFDTSLPPPHAWALDKTGFAAAAAAAGGGGAFVGASDLLAVIAAAASAPSTSSTLLPGASPAEQWAAELEVSQAEAAALAALQDSAAFGAAAGDAGWGAGASTVAPSGAAGAGGAAANASGTASAAGSAGGCDGPDAPCFAADGSPCAGVDSVRCPLVARHANLSSTGGHPLHYSSVLDFNSTRYAHLVGVNGTVFIAAADGRSSGVPATGAEARISVPDSLPPPCLDDGQNAVPCDSPAVSKEASVMRPPLTSERDFAAEDDAQHGKEAVPGASNVNVGGFVGQPLY
jgi:hypothetical protein